MNIDFRYENVIQYGHPGKRYPNTIQEDDFEKIFNKTMISPFGFEETWAPPSTIFVNWPMEVIDKPVILEDFTVSVDRPDADEL
ncbi:hypothetical protein TVAG_494300 [Trichomonas vaginalis G3]|uniref:Uncharacterized protein n=2 Tax=Trichomonas vaginalis (strain ATCC PRA-98 / G3) TaxID=412133 RepID=A2DQ61_TRIV3|nr:hypothetical protein TVAG_494300 [Trichomonas vaginalis G3]|eukprot:XP_001329623.1 hypothetical protein [Trichomonas vaginalis G3]